MSLDLYVTLIIAHESLRNCHCIIIFFWIFSVLKFSSSNYIYFEVNRLIVCTGALIISVERIFYNFICMKLLNLNWVLGIIWSETILHSLYPWSLLVWGMIWFWLSWFWFLAGFVQLAFYAQDSLDYTHIYIILNLISSSSNRPNQPLKIM